MTSFKTRILEPIANFGRQAKDEIRRSGARGALAVGNRLLKTGLQQIKTGIQALKNQEIFTRLQNAYQENKDVLIKYRLALVGGGAVLFLVATSSAFIVAGRPTNVEFHARFCPDGAEIYGIEGEFSGSKLVFPKTITLRDNDGKKSKYPVVSVCGFTVSSALDESGENWTVIDENDGIEVPFASGFSKCANLKSVVVPEGVKFVGDGAFAGCKSLKSIELPTSVKTIGHAAFAGCESLKSIELPESAEYIGSAAFAGCKSLKALEIPESVEMIGRAAFAYCLSLKSITTPENVTRFASPTTELKKIGEEDFSAMNDDEFPASPMMDGIFALMTSTMTVFDPTNAELARANSLLTLKLSLENVGAFEGCASLKSATFRGAIQMRGGDFRGCESLRVIALPESGVIANPNDLPKKADVKRVNQ